MTSSPTESTSGNPTSGSSAAAAVDVVMPQLGVSVAEGTVAAWHREVGDRIEADETIAEVSTDKIDTEIPAPAGGRVLEILVAVGTTVEVGTPLARIGADEEPDAGSAPAEGTDPPGGDAVAQAGETAVPPLSPVVRRIASEHGLDLSGVHGTGRGGRVRKQDVLALVHDGDGDGEGAGAQPPLHAGEIEPVLGCDAPHHRREGRHGGLTGPRDRVAA
ncbi:MAG TPA: biotin/lipoyl-containing protein, partial [Solirubrobacteraceae bacterium]|nr:biotin/lipoyl-containing protein [Solirubrobacteraceae bacterium]